MGGVHGRAGDPGSRSGPEEVDHVRHKDVWQSFSPLYLHRDFCLSDRLVIDNRAEVLIT